MAPYLISTPDEVEQVFSRPPLVTTGGMRWGGLYLDNRWEPASEIGEVCTPWHVATIFTSLPDMTVAERRLDDRLKVETVHTGDVVIVPAFVGHGARWNAGGEFISLVFDPASMVQAMNPDQDVQGITLTPQFARQDLLMLQMALALRRLANSEDGSDCLYGETLATALAVHMLQHYGSRPPAAKTYRQGLATAKLRQIQDYIQAHLDTPLSLEQLAAMVEISPHYFCKLFKQSTGQSPHRYILNQRIERAKALLRTSPLAIAEIAYAVGFTNQSHLNRHFKRATGLTPGQFRRQ